MWGVNWPVMKLGLREMTPLMFRAVTMSGGFVLLFIWYRLRGARLMLAQGELWRVAMLAAPNIVGWHALSIFGVEALASGRAAIVGFTMPIWTVLLSVVLFGERMQPRIWFATACAALAVVLLLWHELAHLSGNPAGVAWMLAAALSWATGTLLLKRVSLGASTEAMTLWMIGLAVPVIWLLALSIEPLPAAWPSPSGWVVIGYGALINYGIAQILWFSIARRLPPAASALSIMMIPLVGLASAMPLTGERPFVADYLAAILILVALSAVLLVGRRPRACHSSHDNRSR
ncbi:MAG: EamA family transporter [Rhodocyclaceae bacterium]|nr:EamA family transporter [Rhodocyclaceae bacterium]